MAITKKNKRQAVTPIVEETAPAAEPQGNPEGPSAPERMMPEFVSVMCIRIVQPDGYEFETPPMDQEGLNTALNALNQEKGKCCITLSDGNVKIFNVEHILRAETVVRQFPRSAFGPKA